jgi:hypothetical protein
MTMSGTRAVDWLVAGVTVAVIGGGLVAVVAAWPGQCLAVLVVVTALVVVTVGRCRRVDRRARERAAAGRGEWLWAQDAALVAALAESESATVASRRMAQAAQMRRHGWPESLVVAWLAADAGRDREGRRG